MKKALIIDDEKSSRDTLRGFVENYCKDIRIIDEAETAEQGIEQIKKLQPQLIFLDIELPLGSGFDLLEACNQADFEVIFTTAHDKYALQAIKVCALDYLLKPISATELIAAVSKISERKLSGTTTLQLGAFVENISNLNKQLSKIVLPTLDGFLVVNINEIIRCEADKNYTLFIFANKEKLLVSKTLKEFDELLHGMDFIRVHQSHLINAAHVKRYIKGSGGYVQMSDDSIIEVSRRKKEHLMQRFLK
jgi:two-component system LytT family response regulator